MLIDTPGLRAVLPHDMGLAAERAFGDIEELAGSLPLQPTAATPASPAAPSRRRWPQGELSRERFEAWQRAEHDRVSFERRSDPAAVSEQRRHHRSPARSLRAARKKHWL